MPWAVARISGSSNTITNRPIQLAHVSTFSFTNYNTFTWFSGPNKDFFTMTDQMKEIHLLPLNIRRLRHHLRYRPSLDEPPYSILLTLDARAPLP